jgi:phage gpG-like protein
MSVSQEFGGLLNSLGRAAGGMKIGRMARSDKAVSGVVGASMLLTLDKANFALAAGRLEPYKHIPAKKGKLAFNRVADFMLSDSDGPIERYFRTESGPSGPWKPLSKAEEYWRLARGRETSPILQDTGWLHAAVTDKDMMLDIVVTGNYARMIIGPQNLSGVSGNVKYKFFTHLLGSLNGWGKGITIPPRPFMPVKQSDLTRGERAKIQNIIRKSIIDATMVRG